VGDVRIVPRCAGGENIFVSAEGYLLPCCYAHILLRAAIADRGKLKGSDLWFYRNLEMLDLKRRPAAEVLADERWSELERLWRTDNAPSICYRYCGVPSGSDLSGPAELRKRDLRTVRLGQDAAK
jgi:hypothetical protein